MPTFLSHLNQQQQQVVKTTAGPVLVLAGAGSGKTRALTYRVAYLLHTHQAKPSEILAVTFTNKAAREMKERVAKLVTNKYPVPNTICTFHHLGARLLREQSHLISRSPSFTIYDSNDSERLLKLVMDDLGVSRQQHSPGKIKHIISTAKTKQQSPTDLMDGGQPDNELIISIYAHYEKLLAKNDAYDFDDLITKPISLLESNPAVKQHYQQHWRWLSVDEYQDTNPPQERLLTLLVGPERNLCVVGDDYQAIYSWRGSNVDHILQFERKYPDCATIYLTRNYRSTPQILNAANHVIAANRQQKHKRLWTNQNQGKPVKVVQLTNHRQEASFVRQQIDNHVNIGGRRGDCAILYRTNAQSRSFEEEFLTYGTPYSIVGGFRFYERKEIKDAIAFLQLWHNANSRLALRRLASVMCKGVGPKTLTRWEQQTSSNYNLMQVANKQGKKLPSVAHFTRVFRQAKDKSFASVSDLLSFLLQQSGYLKIVKILPDGEERLENLEELINVSSVFTDVGRFLEEVALLSDIDTLEQEHDRVTCLTLHAAKGLEYHTVFVVGCEDGLLPHANSLTKNTDLEEERRLLYVGMTRAQKQLFITYAQSRYQHGQYISQSPSRFLKALNDLTNCVELTESRSTQITANPNQDVIDYLESTPSDDTTLVTVEEGYLVNHTHFGRGVVIAVNGNLVTCVFAQHGLKTIAATHLITQKP